MKPVISQEMQELAENLLGPNLNSITNMPVQQQTTSSDCGVCAIAFATCLVFGQDPSEVTFDIPRMRPYLKGPVPTIRFNAPVPYHLNFFFCESCKSFYLHQNVTL